MASKNNSEGSEGQSSDGDCAVNLVRNSVMNFNITVIIHYEWEVSRLSGGLNRAVDMWNPVICWSKRSFFFVSGSCIRTHAKVNRLRSGELEVAGSLLVRLSWSWVVRLTAQKCSGNLLLGATSQIASSNPGRCGKRRRDSQRLDEVEGRAEGEHKPRAAQREDIFWKATADLSTSNSPGTKWAHAYSR